VNRGLFVVRAEVADEADRGAFDRWYEAEHLPDALRSFRAERAWRSWSRTDPAVHYAFYEFASLKAAQGVLESAAILSLIAEFDRVWGSRVARTREVLELVQAIENRERDRGGR
jgi:DNA-binding GntR family transcriptional regulator